MGKAESQFVVGIDLGTTNSAVAYARASAEAESSSVQIYPVLQTVAAGETEARPLLPSFLYLPGPHELPKKSLSLPWQANPEMVVGVFAREHGAQVPTRLIASTKSWLSYASADRTQAILPWGAPDDVAKRSPVEASAAILEHIRQAWDHRVGEETPSGPLADQDVLVTVPASFDAIARELTVEAAKKAGIGRLTLLEEPQAAFYSWIEATGDRWRKQVSVGDVMLVCDIGGGTTDFTLITVSEEEGQLALTRIAVGAHILLGGDNMDRALAYSIARKLGGQGMRLDTVQMLGLVHGCRAAKESLFSDPKPKAAPITLLGRGSKVIGGTVKTELTRAEMESVIVEGFFPDVPPDARPQVAERIGLQELGLPFAADPAVSKHLACFLSQQAGALEREGVGGMGSVRTKGGTKRKGAAMLHPSAVLFNGGVFKAEPLRRRVIDILNAWAADDGNREPIRVLEGTDLDLAVARGAAYYGLVRQGKGVRIRGGVARTYYVGVASSEPAVPGVPPPIKALCVVPFGMEEGTEADIPGREFGLVVGEQAEFRFLSSTSRQNDPIGVVVEDWTGQIEELTPLRQALEPAEEQGGVVPVHLHSRVTEVGTLELSCRSRDGARSWKLEFNVREPETQPR
jgi:hypothetical protein